MPNQHTAAKSKARPSIKPTPVDPVVASIESILDLLKNLQEPLVCSSPDPVLTTRYFQSLKGPREES